MTVMLNLPSELESKLSREAAERGVTLTEHMLSILGSRVPAQPLSRSGEQVVAYWHREELLGTRPSEGDSAAHARTLRTRVERRERP